MAPAPDVWVAKRVRSSHLQPPDLSQGCTSDIVFPKAKGLCGQGTHVCGLKDCDDEAATGRRALRFTLQQLLKNPDDSLLDILRKLFSSKCPGWFVAITRGQAAFLVMGEAWWDVL